MHAETSEQDQQREQDFRAIAYLVNRIRPAWHTPGIMAVLRDTDAPIADTALAALACARDRTDQHKPAVIALDGPHWHLGTQAPTAPTPAIHEPSCAVCGYRETVHDRACAAWPAEDRHPFTARRLTTRNES